MDDVQLNSTNNSTFVPRNDSDNTDMVLGVTLAGIIVLCGAIWCLGYYVKMKRTKKAQAGSQAPKSYVIVGDKPVGGRRIVDPLEKKPYTQLTLPTKSKDKSKYGVCRYKDKEETTSIGSTRKVNAADKRADVEMDNLL